MILDNGLKIMSIDATDLFRVEVESTKNKKGKEIKVAKRNRTFWIIFLLRLL